ncbi:MAG: NRDE family protein [Acidobacteriales bacterium]|nr:NRDE family protein [Terriglobales bacterium]
MCTLSFVPKDGGYLLAMNRDERLARQAALPPHFFGEATFPIVYPHEPEGGTWIGANAAGVAFALLNWNIPADRSRQRVSRGTLIPLLLPHADATSAGTSLEDRDLSGVLPFRLVGFFPGAGEIREWHWDMSALASHAHSWMTNHWFSSGAGDDLAELHRGMAVGAAQQDPSAGSLDWLRALHRSHAPARGPFSLCAHREDAGSVSYTEIVCLNGTLQMSYHPGPPCERSPGHTLSLRLRALQEQPTHV